MPALANLKRERLARLISAGKPIPEAYAAAGYAPDKGNAHRVAKLPAVVARVGELQAEALASEGITAERLVAELASIAFADLSGIAADGTLKSGHVLTDAQRRGIVSVEVTTDPKGRKTTKVRFGDKLAALQLLAKWKGLDRDNGSDQHLHVHVESPLAMIQERLELLKTRLSGPTIDHS